MKQGNFSAIAAYTAMISPTAMPKPTALPSSTPPPIPLTCQSTGTYLMQYATATSAASAYCTAIAYRVPQGTAQVACAVQNKDPPYKVGSYPTCANQADIRFQIINDNRDTAACQGATIKNRFSVQGCVQAYMTVLNQCKYKGKSPPPFPPHHLSCLSVKNKEEEKKKVQLQTYVCRD